MVVHFAQFQWFNCFLLHFKEQDTRKVRCQLIAKSSSVQGRWLVDHVTRMEVSAHVREPLHEIGS